MPSENSLKAIEDFKYKSTSATKLEKHPVCFKVSAEVKKQISEIPDSSTWLRELVAEALKERMSR